MTLNDMRTLRSKMDLMSRNTMNVAEFLQKHPQVESVAYLGLPDHPLHELASRYMWLVDAEHDEHLRPAGEPLWPPDVVLREGVATKGTRKFFDGLQRIWRATDLGRIKSVATIPGHQHAPAAGRGRAANWHTFHPTWSASA